MSNRAFHIYELAALAALPAGSTGGLQPWQSRESSMKFMTRAVACMPDDSGYASSSIEGRVAVEWFDPSDESQKRKYAFKCHRTTGEDGSDIVFPVNALAFHPTRNVFASGGGDGVVSLWDAMAKRRIKQYQKFGSSVATAAFSCDGRFLAVGCSPGFEDGREPDEMGESGMVKVVVRVLADDEAKMKAKK
jgi:cell cycle arrest protein BUB3